VRRLGSIQSRQAGMSMTSEILPLLFPLTKSWFTPRVVTPYPPSPSPPLPLSFPHPPPHPPSPFSPPPPHHACHLLLHRALQLHLQRATPALLPPAYSAAGAPSPSARATALSPACTLIATSFLIPFHARCCRYEGRFEGGKRSGRGKLSIYERDGGWIVMQVARALCSFESCSNPVETYLKFKKCVFMARRFIVHSGSMVGRRACGRRRHRN
jgi:hypothetical protein